MHPSNMQSKSLAVLKIAPDTHTIATTFLADFCPWFLPERFYKTEVTEKSELLLLDIYVNISNKNSIQ